MRPLATGMSEVEGRLYQPRPRPPRLMQVGGIAFPFPIQFVEWVM
jgi:hypothetical protein